MNRSLYFCLILGFASLLGGLSYADSSREFAIPEIVFPDVQVDIDIESKEDQSKPASSSQVKISPIVQPPEAKRRELSQPTPSLSKLDAGQREESGKLSAKENVHDASPEAHEVESALGLVANKYWEGEVKKHIHMAHVAMRLNDFDTAEHEYLEALNSEMEDDQRKEILKEMITVYESLGILSKVAAVHERYLELYPRDASVAEIYMGLGRIYRDMGAYEMSIDRLYSVLNLSVGARGKKLESLRKLALEAQLEIAETYFLIEDYDQARVFFERLKQLNITDAQRENVDFKYAYSLFQLGHYIDALVQYDFFILKRPQSALVPEIRFMKATSLKRLGRGDDAIFEIKKLLEYEARDTPQGHAIWLYWQKKTANQVANEFYSQGDFMSALRVYQAMLPLTDNIEWQWPIIYQMGLCFERLSMHPKALQAYQVIIDITDWKVELDVLSSHLKSIREMAVWRKEHLEWVIESNGRLRKLLSPNVGDLISTQSTGVL